METRTPMVLPSCGSCQSRGTWTVAQARPLTFFSSASVAGATEGNEHSPQATACFVSAPASTAVSGSALAAGAAPAAGAGTRPEARNAPATTATAPLRVFLVLLITMIPFDRSPRRPYVK